MASLQGPVLRPDLEKRLRQHSQTRRYRRHDIVCAADSGENFFFIVSEGCLRVYFAHVSGREFSLSTLEPGSLFTSHSGLNVEAVADSVIHVIDAALIQQIMLQDADFFKYLMQIIGDMLKTSLHCIESLVFENVEYRLAEYLLQQLPSVDNGWTREKRTSTEPQQSVNPTNNRTDSASESQVFTKQALSVEEIAKFVGCSRQSVSLIIGQWEREGVVSHRHRRIYVDNPIKLKALAKLSI